MAGLRVREMYPELSKYFFKEISDVTWEEFFFIFLHYGLIHARALITHSMVVVGQWKKRNIVSDRKST